MKDALRNEAMILMTATSIVKNIRPECMNAAETIGKIVDALISAYERGKKDTTVTANEPHEG